MQSVPKSHTEKEESVPPSSQTPSPSQEQVALLCATEAEKDALFQEVLVAAGEGKSD